MAKTFDRTTLDIETIKPNGMPRRPATPSMVRSETLATTLRIEPR